MILISLYNAEMDYLKRLPLFIGLFLLAIVATFVMWLADMAERAYWRKYTKLKMGSSDGYHVSIGGRCYTK